MSKIQFKKTNYAGITKKVVDNKIYGYRVMYDLGRIQKYDPKTESYKTVQKKSTKMCDTLEEAIDFKLKMDKKRRGLLKEDERLTFFKAFDDFLDYINKDLSTDLSYKNSIKNHINHMKKFFDGPDERKYIDKTNSLVLEDYYLWCFEVEHLKKTTIIHHKTTLNLFFNYLVKRGVIKENLAKNSDINVEKSDFEGIALDIDQLNRVIKYAAEHEDDFSVLCLVSLAGLAGMRRGEIAGLQWDDVDFDNRKIYINHNRVQISTAETNKLPKGDKVRYVPICDTLYEVLTNYKLWQESILRTRKKKLQDNDLVYKTEINLKADYNPSTGKISRRFREFLNRMNKYFRKNGEREIPVIRLHDLRHTYVTLLMSGVYIDNEFIPPADFVQVHFSTGHKIQDEKNTTATKKYLHDLGNRDSITDFLNKTIIKLDLTDRSSCIRLDWDNPRKKYKKASETKLKRAVEENKETEILDNDAPLDNIHDFKRIKKE